MLRKLTMLALAGALLTGCIATVTTQPAESRDDRVRRHFTGLGVESTGYLLVSEETVKGVARSLWVTAPGAFDSRCFYLDVEKQGSVYSLGSCSGEGTESVTLSGNPETMVGDAGTWPATQARLKVSGQEATTQIKNGFFLVPGELAALSGGLYTVVLLDATGVELAEVKDIKPAG